MLNTNSKNGCIFNYQFPKIVTFLSFYFCRFETLAMRPICHHCKIAAYICRYSKSVAVVEPVVPKSVTLDTLNF